ncbi:MAG: membrane dipeptidase [Marinilabiliales bacterium]|nr:MAG: membrane dipeptidase [Marinilabiliales bacterium]
MKRCTPCYVLIVFFLFSSFVSGDNEKEVLDKAKEIHKRVLTLDSHCDTPLWLKRDDYKIGEKHDAHETQNRVDLPRMKEGGLDAIFFAVFLGQGPRTDSANEQAWNEANSIIDRIEQQIKVNDTVAVLAYSSNDAYKAEDENKRAIYLGLENGYPIGEDLSKVEKFYNRGIRYITLSHSKNNDICDSANDTLEFGGLSEFGEEVVAEMNRLGIMVDVSHISDSAFYDVLKLSKVPVIASHSNCRAVCDNPRNLTDDMIKKLAEKGGVVQVCVLNSYVHNPPPNPQRDSAIAELRKARDQYKEVTEAVHDSIVREWYALQKKYPEKLATVSQLVDHIDHIVKIGGIDHAGIGTDFDGGGGIEGCYDVAEMPNITEELVRRGYSDEDIRKIWGGNFMRVFKAVEEYAANN